MLKKKNTKRSSPPAGAKGNGHKLPTNFHELFLVLILVYNYGFVKNFYRLDNILSQARQNFVKGMIIFYHRLDNSCCYLLFFLFGLSNYLRIRGYLIKYPRIFHHVSVDISLRIRGYAKFLLCLRGLLVVCFWFFSYDGFVLREVRATPTYPLPRHRRG